MKPFQPVSRRGQSGVALIVALVMLVIIGLMSAAVLRGSLTSDLIANNARSQTLAQQEAELALRWCEREALDAVNGNAVAAGFAIQAEQADDDANTATPLPVLWDDFASWFGANKKAIDVVDDERVTDDSSVVAATPPQCMAEYTRLTDGALTQVVIVTARGFSPDYQEDDDGRTRAGSVVWLQSVLRFGT